jgi:hypothetical protein
MHVVITIELTTIMLLILAFQLKLTPCFFTWISFKIQNSYSELEVCCH